MVKRKIVWSTQADLDLFEIQEFYFKQNGTKTFSIKLNSTLRKSVRLLGNYAGIGQNTDFINIKSLTEGNFSIFYEIKPQTIEIIAIWDNRQDPANLSLKI